MSRALDKATVAALASGDTLAAYQAIADVLTPPSSDVSASSRLAIELIGRECLPLPGDCPYYLREGNAVAFSKLALVMAFAVARSRLQSPPPVGGTADVEPEADNEKLRATAVILMMDPEHLTAANTRKRILLGRMSKDAEAVAAIMASELWLIDSILTGHLHRHTKSPNLWNHRRWLLAYASSHATRPVRVVPLRDITEVVMVAAERHPRNYYAWTHARWLVRAAADAADAAETASAPVDQVEHDKLALAVRDWCCQHPTDTSGWSFLLFLLTSACDMSRAPSPLLAEIIVQVAQMAASLRLMGESVWVFLRTAVAYTELARMSEAGTLEEAASAMPYAIFTKAAKSLQSYVAPTSHEHQVLQQALDWCAAKINKALPSDTI